MTQKKVILLPHGERTRLAKDFKTTYVTVRDALDFKTNSSLAKMLRAAALERGGCEYQSQKQ
jgi:hypothetical protein